MKNWDLTASPTGLQRSPLKPQVWVHLPCITGRYKAHLIGLGLQDEASRWAAIQGNITGSPVYTIQ